MNIKVHIAMVLAICTITGFLLGLGLVMGYERVERQMSQLGSNSVALRDAARLETLLGQWLLSVDLVLKDTESHMINASIRQHEELLALLRDIRGAQLAENRIEDLVEIEHSARRVQELVDDAKDLRGPEREQRLLELVAKADAFSAPLIHKVQALEGQMQSRSRYLTDDLEEKQALLSMLTIAAAAIYLMVAAFFWLWTVRSTVRPIENLSLAAERAQIDDSFALDEQGPEEVRRLTRNISSFVNLLQTAKERTEEEVHRRTEQLIKANSAKSEFLATMSHELRTPLNGIINMNELILGTELDQEQTEFARTAKNASEALFALINDILDFSKIEARKLELDHVEFKLRDVIDGAVEIMTGVAEAKGLELCCIVDRKVPIGLVSDSMRMRQIVINLLNNALKFTEKGSVVVRVTLAEDQSLGENVNRRGQDQANLAKANANSLEQWPLLRIEVSDTGIGIPEDRVACLFRAFEQVDASTTREYGGTGLGLAISKELAELMGGDIGVESEVGAGSTFWFTIRAELHDNAWSGRLEQEMQNQQLFLLGERELIKERLSEQLSCLSLNEQRIHGAAFDEDPMAQIRSLHGEGDPLAIILDPNAAEGSSWSTLKKITVEFPKARICVLKDVLRNKASNLAPLPVGVEWLPSPTSLDVLVNWLSGTSALPKQQRITAELAEAKTEDGRKYSVLVAEDNLVNQRIAQKVLENAGFQVTLVGDGEKAVQHISDTAFDVILMDCQMPIMDGWEATKEIRMRESNGELAAGCPTPLPIIALTANAMASDREECLAAGMSDHLAKPFRPKELVATVKKHLASALPTA